MTDTVKNQTGLIVGALHGVAGPVATAIHRRWSRNVCEFCFADMDDALDMQKECTGQCSAWPDPDHKGDIEREWRDD